MLSSRTLLFVGLGIILVQIIDIIIHAATNQLEPIRVASNVIMLAGVVLLAIGRFKTQFRLVVAGITGAYLILNLVFLAVNGVTNAEQGDAPRTMLFVLVALTILLAALFTYLGDRSQSTPTTLR